MSSYVVSARPDAYPSPAEFERALEFRRRRDYPPPYGYQEEMEFRHCPVHWSRFEIEEDSDDDYEDCCVKLCDIWSFCCWPFKKIIDGIMYCVRNPPPVQTARGPVYTNQLHQSHFTFRSMISNDPRQDCKLVRKHMKFVSSPMGIKSTRALPGIEETVSEELADRGLFYAYQLFHNYLRLNRSSRLFTQWMMLHSRITLVDALTAFYALQAYDQIFVKNRRQPDVVCV